MTWKIEYKQLTGGYEVITSTGFRWNFRDIEDIIHTIPELTLREYPIQTSMGDRLYIDSVGIISLIDPDFINYGWKMNDRVTDSFTLSKVLADFIKERFIDG